MKTKTLGLVALAGLFTGAVAFAQDTPITIRAGRLLDGVGGERENVTITVEASRITGLDAAAGPVTYDLSDLTLMPGWIDTHVHLTNHFDADGRNHSDPDETPAQAILYGAENAYRTLMAGFTTVQSLGSPRDLDLREAIARGSLIGIGGHLAVPPLPHHRAYGSVPRRFGRLSGQGRSRYGNPSESK